MNWLDFISSVISSIAWPTSLVIIGLLFREQIRELVSSLKINRLKLGGMEAEFSGALETAEEELAIAEIEDGVLDVGPSEKLLAYLDVDKKFAVLAAWMEIEENLYRLRELKGFKTPKGRRSPILYSLIKQLELPKSVNIPIDELKRARNQIANAADFEMTESQILRYLDIAADIVHYLEREIREYSANGQNPEVSHPT